MELARTMALTLADLEQSLAEGDPDMAGDHALTLEELAQEFQRKASR